MKPYETIKKKTYETNNFIGISFDIVHTGGLLVHIFSLRNGGLSGKKPWKLIAMELFISCFY